MLYTSKIVFFVFIVAVVLLKAAVSQECSSLDLKFLCNEQESCDKCVQAHHCCFWCYEENFTGFRCNFLEELSQCGHKIEQNLNSQQETTENEDFTEIKSTGDAKNVIQIRPQHFKVKLRKDVPVNLTFTYKAVKNYPLDLYYLGDLSYSMLSDLNTLKTLGDDLRKSLENLTINYKLAYGTFMDKPGMPFYRTDATTVNNPCTGADLEECEKGYLYKHRLDFTSDTKKFFREVKRSRITANIDDLDGALDAIFQILVCNKIGWSEFSRKFILLPTDSLLHVAGDGLLVGAVLRNRGECLIDDDGNHTDPLKYDYPSVGEIHTLLKNQKVNLIFAVKNEKIRFYDALKVDILKDEAFVGKLEKDSTNILSLIETGFFNFIRQVQFSTNTSHANELDVQFFGRCPGHSEYNVTQGCYNIQEEEPVEFVMQLTLKEITYKGQETIYIKEKSINEQIKVDIEYVGCQCACANYTGENLDCGEHGEFSCGSCRCSEGWHGKTCEEECGYDVSTCRLNSSGIVSTTCFSNGLCECGKCLCDFPYSGQYCEYQCPFNNRTRKICSGKNHGVCVKGKCNCESTYMGDDCSCETSTENCKFAGAENLCNNHGTCQCNECVCAEGYTGYFCEKTPEKNIFCETYEQYVRESVENGTTAFKRNGVDFVVKKIEHAEKETCDNDCELIYFKNTSRCSINYCYHRGVDNSAHLLTKREVCLMTGSAPIITLFISIFVAVVLGGLLIIFIQKFRIYKADQAEYKRFINESKNLNEMNPLYKSPTTMYRNPMVSSN